jgi:transcription elongation factor GreB
MSRAFVKESDTVDALPEIPLSEHPNHTTPAGLARQQLRLHELRARAPADATLDATLDDQAASQAIARETRWLEARIASAQVVDPASQPRDRVAFGATVELIDEHDQHSRYRIVGEDEADAEHGSVSWVSPLAQAVLGARVGDEVTWRRPAGDLRLEIAGIRYE